MRLVALSARGIQGPACEHSRSASRAKSFQARLCQAYSLARDALLFYWIASIYMYLSCERCSGSKAMDKRGGVYYSRTVFVTCTATTWPTRLLGSVDHNTFCRCRLVVRRTIIEQRACLYSNLSATRTTASSTYSQASALYQRPWLMDTLSDRTFTEILWSLNYLQKHC